MSSLEKTNRIYSDSVPFVPYGRAVALGFFDGVHTGHADIIRKMVMAAKKNKLRSTVQTFSNFPKGDGRDITTLEERLEILNEMGVDEMFVIDFESVRNNDPVAFLEGTVRNTLNAKALFVGEDYRFGKAAAGDADLLKTFGKENDIAVKVFADKIFPGTDRRISSTWIRECIASGDVELASSLMGGRQFAYSGIVTEGKKLGRELGFPTANIDVPSDKIVARRGVYVSRVTLGNSILYGVTNIGRRPTVENVTNDVAETFILDFDEDIYGARITVELLKFVRDEKKFDSKESLMAEVEANKIEAKTYLEESGIILKV